MVKIELYVKTESKFVPFSLHKFPSSPIQSKKEKYEL